MHSTFSASLSSNTIGSTKGFVSFSSNSVFSQQRSTTYAEILKSNILQLSTNIHRFTGLDSIWHNISAFFRLVQTFCIYLIPRCKVFWNMNLSTSFFNYLLKIPLHLCFLPGDTSYHTYFLMILFLFFLISIIFICVIIYRNPAQYSISNSSIFYICLFCSVLSPILTCFVFTLFGFTLNAFVFGNDHSSEVIVAIVFGSLSIILSLISHYFSYYVIESTSVINFSLLFVPWAPYTHIFAHFNTYIFILGFLEEFLPVEQKYYQIGFSIASLVIANPIVIFYIFYNPIFQDLNDIPYFATSLTINMISVILMDIRFLTPKLNPVVLFVVDVVSFAFFFLLYKYIVRYIITKYSKKLFSVYKHTKPSLPVTTPLVFTTPMPNQILLSRDAYSVMQAFSSLGISTIREFHYYIFVGTYMKMSAIKNLDFIKWGLNYFHDVKTLIICTQVCQYFNDKSQTQAVLIQKLNEVEDLSFFITPVIYNLILYHSDVVSDKSAFLKKIFKKANGGLVRSRRALSVFWGSVLKHSANQMSESLCKLRDSITETRTHFDELTRCYPYSLESMALYLSFMTEICGEYILCNRYINKMSAKFIEMKSDSVEIDDSYDGISLLLNDQNRDFSPYITRLTQYLDQESHGKEKTNRAIITIWFLGIVSSITLIACLLIIMSITLVSFNKYPKILSIVNSADDVFIELASLTLGARRICLYSSGVLDYDSIVHPNDTGYSVYDHPRTLLPWIIERGEKLPSLIIQFYQNLTTNLDMLRAVARSAQRLEVFGSIINGRLTYIIDMMSMAIRNIAVNIPSYFTEIATLQSDPVRASIRRMRSSDKSKRSLGDEYNFFDDHEGIDNYTGICNSSEMRLLLQNIEAASSLCDSFISEFQKLSERQIESLSKTLHYSMIFFPAGYILVFGVVLAFLTTSIYKEFKFRHTLFLSLPEQVASEIYNTGAHSSIRKLQNSSEDPISSDNANEDLESPEKLQAKERALRIEGLHQFSSVRGFITGTGLKEYTISSALFILIAALSIFVLTYYSKSVNETFLSRSFMLCASALRFSSISYASMFVEESFFTGNIAMLNQSEIIRLGQKFLARAQQFHMYLTQGSDTIKLTYLEYKGIEELMLNKVEMDIPDILTIEKTYSLLRHEGYMADSCDTFMRLFISSSLGMLETYQKDPDYYKLTGNTWEYYNHLIVSHLISELSNATTIYLRGVSDVIDESFTIAVVVSIVFIVFLLIIFIGPILNSSLALTRYFSIQIRALCQIPPEVFSRSFYINKWIKGQITKANYSQYETTFTRNISKDFQKKLLQESSEKVIIFASNGEYVESPCYDTSGLNEKTLQNVLNLALNSIDQATVDEIQRAFDRFQEAKDKIENIVIVRRLLKENKSFKITVTGIQLSYLSSSAISLQKYYSYVLILISDFTKEANIEDAYKIEREKTAILLQQVIPRGFAVRLHEGEEFISFLSTIGSVLTVSFDNYNQCLENVDFSVVGEIMVKFREAVYRCLSEFENLSLISFSGDEILLIAGLFNDDQNGVTEATDTLNFAFKLSHLLTEIFDNYNLQMSIKIGIATGGPIFCKVIGSDPPVCIAFGEIIKMSKILRDLCSNDELLFERTTFECCSHLNIQSQEKGEFDFQGKKNLFYSIPIVKNSQIVI